MNKKTIPTWLILIAFSFFLCGFKVKELEDADAIMTKATKNLAVNSEIGLIQVSTTTNDGTVNQRRILSIVQKDPAGNFSYVVRFLSPDDVAGVTLLTRETGNGGSEQYLYLPALGKIREIKGSQKSSNFMGTDFSFEDLRLEKTVEYTYIRQIEENVDGRPCYVILSSPADSMQLTAKKFGSRMIYIDKQNYNILKIEYQDESFTLSKTFQAYDYNSNEVDGPTRRPRRAVMTNHEKGSTSVMVLIKSRLNYQIDPNVFTAEAVESWTPEVTEGYLSIFNTQQKK